jgi:hypothetical protein
MTKTTRPTLGPIQTPNQRVGGAFLQRQIGQVMLLITHVYLVPTQRTDGAVTSLPRVLSFSGVVPNYKKYWDTCT